MEIFKIIIGVVTAFAGVLGLIGSSIATTYWAITIVIMSVIKLVGVSAMPWFAGPLTAGAISTGLWMLVLGIVFWFLSALITAIGGAILQDA
jgi:hypothetical protein